MDQERAALYKRMEELTLEHNVLLKENMEAERIMGESEKRLKTLREMAQTMMTQMKKRHEGHREVELEKKILADVIKYVDDCVEYAHQSPDDMKKFNAKSLEAWSRNVKSCILRRQKKESEDLKGKTPASMQEAVEKRNKAKQRCRMPNHLTQITMDKEETDKAAKEMDQEALYKRMEELTLEHNVLWKENVEAERMAGESEKRLKTLREMAQIMMKLMKQSQQSHIQVELKRKILADVLKYVDECVEYAHQSPDEMKKFNAKSLEVWSRRVKEWILRRERKESGDLKGKMQEVVEEEKCNKAQRRQ